MTPTTSHPQPRRTPRRRGISITEMLVALAISAMLLTAVTVALNASFYAYANAAESASTNSSVRLVMQRMMRMIRNAHLHDAYDPDSTISLQPPGSGPLHTTGIQMLNHDGTLVRIWWEVNTEYNDPFVGDLWYSEGNAVHPLLERVTAQEHEEEPYVFALLSRDSREGLLLSRATLDLMVQPGADATLTVESAQGKSPPVRLIASTMPRRNMD